MKIPRRQFLHLAAGAAALPAALRVARAQTYPTRPITLVVGAAAGGPTDTIGRIITERMRASLGQTIIIENNGSAAGSIAHGRVAGAAPDGYTLSIGEMGTHVVNGAIYALPYDLRRDFEPITLLNSNSILVVAKKAMPGNDLKGLIAWLKANPGKASVGTSGAGSIPHLAGVLFQNVAEVSVQFVPYRGIGPAMQDLVGDQIDMIFSSPAAALSNVRAGKIRAYAVAAEGRLSVAPEIPTADEAGLPEFHVTTWFGLWAPKGTPKEVIAKLNSAAVTALADPTVQMRLTDLGLEIFPRDQQTPEALGARQRADIEKWWPIIKAANIKGQ
jgi:tripartite-type tricarboxylate transporter receptor subunit TctC